ncbi:MAG: cytochrome C [FCB group bacterium]|nr:cytochrome C [FCB group bacterium]
MKTTQHKLLNIRSAVLMCGMLLTMLAAGTTPVLDPALEIDDLSAKCIACHSKENIAVKQIEAWGISAHAANEVGCYECHSAKKADFDAFTCEGSDILVAKHPTPKDCAECHDKEVAEFNNSKHAHQFWLLANADRATFENPLSTRNGCEQCHQIGNLWPDGSVGECDACHPKHSFDIAVARQPETCGECHIGPDHPHIEIYNESKHGNIFKAKSKDWDMGFSSKDNAPIPIEAPVCTTCHMDGNESQPMTHNVSARLAWESQAPWSFRTVWDEKNLGDWQQKRDNMEAICQSCHAPGFYQMYLLTADLVNLQYNEMRRFFVYWTKKLTKNGLINQIQADDKMMSNPVLNGWDEEPEVLMYKAWHHEGRRFRHGAEMMGADYTQWHGVWEIQQDMVELLTWAAEHGDAEAEEWVTSNSPAKFTPYALYDVPGNSWGIGAMTNTTPYVYKAYDDYWERVKLNVQAAYEKGLLSKDQWDLWLDRFENRDYYLGTQFTNNKAVQKTWNFYKDRKAVDGKAMKEQVINFKLPGQPYFEENK